MCKKIRKIGKSKIGLRLKIFNESVISMKNQNIHKKTKKPSENPKEIKQKILIPQKFITHQTNNYKNSTKICYKIQSRQ
jgi:hypothetical protein